MQSVQFRPAVVMLAALFAMPGFSQSARNFFDDSTVQQVHLDLDPNDWAALQANFQDNTYYHATFNWNGVSEAVGIRSHGGGSRSPIKPNLDVNFAKYTKTQTFLGLPFVLLKANNEDPTNLREWLSMKLYRKMGITAPREAPAQVYINGQLLGFFYIVEHLDETYLQRNFGESGGYLYEWQSLNNYDFENLGTSPALYADFVDLKTDQDQPDLQTLANLVQVINQPSSATFNNDAFIAALSQYLDPKQFLTYGAVEQVLAGTDSLIGGQQGMNNFYLYQFQGTTRYEFIPWDKDFTFSGARDVLFGITTGPNINLLAARLYSIPQYQQVYLAAANKAAHLLGGTGGWADSEISREYAVIHDAATNDPNKQCLISGTLFPCGNRDFEDGVQILHYLLGSQAASVQSAVASDGYMPSTGGPQVAASTLSAFGGSQAQLSPGALATFDGTALADPAQAASLPLPRVLGNSFVAVEGVRAPLVTTASGNIVFQVPGDIGFGPASIVVTASNGDRSDTVDTSVVSAGPVILAFVHADGSPVSAASPAMPGETVSIYATGLGAVNVNLPLGSAAPSDASATTLASPQVFVGGAELTVAFSGLAPGFVGLYQVNAVVPMDMPPDSSAGALTLVDNGQAAAWPVQTLSRPSVVPGG